MCEPGSKDFTWWRSKNVLVSGFKINVRNKNEPEAIMKASVSHTKIPQNIWNLIFLPLILLDWPNQTLKKMVKGKKRTGTQEPTWIDNSLVGQMQSAWGLCCFGSTRLNMPSTKQVVLPEPLCAWAIKSLYGGVMIIGRLIAWILLGFWNFISTYKPLRSSGDRFKSSNVDADVYGVSPVVTYIKLNCKI